MKMLCKNILLGLVLTALSLGAEAKDYPASLFGIRSDGTVLNTRSIQFAIDYINQQGGGRLVFSVGHYLTGSIYLKSNVTIHLEEGAVLMGSLNPFDYDRKIFMAMIFAYDQHDVGITGKGIIDGQGREVAAGVTELIHKGLISDPFRNDRPVETNRPMIINFRNCHGVNISGITLRNSACWVETYDQCTLLRLDSIHVDSKAFWNNDGADIVDCDSVCVTNSFFDAADDGICLKSHDASKCCDHFLIRDNTIRSSANAIKFGTASYGGFRDIKIVHNVVYDTYRSALALEAVDGGLLANVEVDSLRAINTGNALFLRIGERVAGKKALMDSISISHVYVEVPESKPDAGYPYEGPIEDQPRNISPAVIAGMPDAPIQGVTITDVEIHYPGGGSPFVAKVGLDELDKIPERPTAYPEFSMFKELPAWGLYIRHARGLVIERLKLVCGKQDYRPAIVADDLEREQFHEIKIEEPDHKSNIVINLKRVYR
jgi:hypothetical protein